MDDIIYFSSVDDELNPIDLPELIVSCGGKELARYYSEFIPELGDSISILGHMGCLYKVVDIVHLIDPSVKSCLSVELKVNLKSNEED